jgi:serine/threonine-protein kinase
VVLKKAAKRAKDQPELIQLVAAEIGDLATRVAFEKAFSEDSRPMTQPPKTTTNPPTAAAASRFSTEVLERAERRLADYIGGVARVLVKRAAMKARDERELYLLLADEIENKEERRTFLRKSLSVSGKPLP